MVVNQVELTYCIVPLCGSGCSFLVEEHLGVEVRSESGISLNLNRYLDNRIKNVFAQFNQLTPLAISSSR